MDNQELFTLVRGYVTLYKQDTRNLYFFEDVIANLKAFYKLVTGVPKSGCASCQRKSNAGNLSLIIFAVAHIDKYIE